MYVSVFIRLAHWTPRSVLPLPGCAKKKPQLRGKSRRYRNDLNRRESRSLPSIPQHYQNDPDIPLAPHRSQQLLKIIGTDLSPLDHVVLHSVTNRNLITGTSNMEQQQATQRPHHKLSIRHRSSGDRSSTVADAPPPDQASRENRAASQAVPMIKTRVLVLSNTYGLSHHLSGYKADLVLHCGDLTGASCPSEYTRALELLQAIDAPFKIVIPGRNDSFLFADRERVPTQVLPSVQEIRHMFKQAESTASPVVLERTGALLETSLPNGAYLRYFASPYVPAPFDTDRYSEMNEDCDIALTYEPPYGILDVDGTGSRIGSPELLGNLARCKPRVHCFAQPHQSWGTCLGTWTDQNPFTIGELTITEVDGWLTREPPVRVAPPMRPQLEDPLHNKKTLFVNASTWDPEHKHFRPCFYIDIDLPAVPPPGWRQTVTYPASRGWPKKSHEVENPGQILTSEGSHIKPK